MTAHSRAGIDFHAHTHTPRNGAKIMDWDPDPNAMSIKMERLGNYLNHVRRREQLTHDREWSLLASFCQNMLHVPEADIYLTLVYFSDYFKLERFPFDNDFHGLNRFSIIGRKISVKWRVEEDNPDDVYTNIGTVRHVEPYSGMYVDFGSGDHVLVTQVDEWELFRAVQCVGGRKRGSRSTAGATEANSNIAEG